MPVHSALRRFCRSCGRTNRQSNRAYPPRPPRTLRSVTVPCPNPSTWCSACRAASPSTDRGPNLDCTQSSSSTLCPGNTNPTKSTYRWVSRGSSKGIHGAAIPLFSATKRVSVHVGSCSIDSSRSIDGCSTWVRLLLLRCCCCCSVSGRRDSPKSRIWAGAQRSASSSAPRQSWTWRGVAEAPIRPMRQALPLKSPRPPPISRP